jgi:hypothetical protein
MQRLPASWVASLAALVRCDALSRTSLRTWWVDQLGDRRRGQFSPVQRYWAAMAVARIPTVRRIAVSGSRDCMRAPV